MREKPMLETASMTHSDRGGVRDFQSLVEAGVIFTMRSQTAHGKWSIFSLVRKVLSSTCWWGYFAQVSPLFLLSYRHVIGSGSSVA